MALDPRQELARFKKELADAETRIVWLRAVVHTMEKAGIEPATTPASRPGAPSGKSRIRAMTPPPIKRGARVGLKNVIFEAMQDGVRRDVGQVIAAVEQSGRYNGTELPKRVSFTNRLNDLVNEGKLLSLARGIYVHAQSEGPNKLSPSDQGTGEGREQRLQVGTD